MSNSKLDALKAAFEKKTSDNPGNGDWKKFFPFWKIAVDTTAVFRFLPDLDPDNSMQFLVEKKVHELTVNGQRKTVPCLQMWGEKCPCCDLARKHYDDKNDSMGKKYYRKLSYVGQGIVMESPIEHDQSQLVKLIEFGPQVFNQIKAGFQSGDLEEPPYEMKGGYNFRFRKTKTGDGQNSYVTSNFAPKQTDLGDDVIEQITLYNLKDYLGQKMSVEAMEALLVADQTGQTVKEETEEERVVAPATKTEAHAETPTEVKSSEPPVEKSASNLSVLEQLRARTKAASANVA